MPTDAEKIKELEAKIKELEKLNAFLVSKVNDFESGENSLYHAVNKKMTELSRILNKHKLDEVDIDDKNSKTFDRISAILEKCEKYALSANALGARINAGQNEEGQIIGSKLRKITTPESVADSVGAPAGMNK